MKLLRGLKFPVYPIPNAGVIRKDDGRLVYEVSSGNVYVIDDPKLEGSFPQRRLMIEGVKLPLRKSIPTLGNLILYSKLYRTFIDSNGKLFKYKRNYTVTTIIRKIVQKISYKNGSMIIAENIHCPFAFYRPLKSEEQYVVLALVEQGYILLGVSTRNYMRRNKIKI